MQMPWKRRLNTPGPGSYNATLRPITPHPPAFTMGAKFELHVGGGGGASTSSGTGDSPDWEPGPGTYAASAHRLRYCPDGPAITIAARCGADDSPAASRYASDAPGPGAYAAIDRAAALTRWRQPAYSIASRNYCFHREISPGPGAYNVSVGTAESTSPAFSIAGRIKPHLVRTGVDGQESPGPGSYDAPERAGSPAITIGGAGRVQPLTAAAVAAAPGPGTYNPSRMSPRSRGITISCRRPTRPIEESPGPGQYDLPPPVERRALSILGGKRRSILSSSSGGSITVPTPGPGSYNTHLLKCPSIANPPSYTIATRTHRLAFDAVSGAAAADDTPGPGAYFSLTDAAAAARAVKIGGRPRQPPRSPRPGPGAYNPAAYNTAAHGISITSKKACTDNFLYQVIHAAQGSPGPANYFASSTAASCADNLKHSSSPAISIGVRFRPSILASADAAAAPGPGAYNLPHLRTGPAFSMHSRSARYGF